MNVKKLLDIFWRKPKTDIRVICTEGDHQLGGKNWDDRIVQYYLSEFHDKTGTDIMQGNPQDVHEALYDLRIAAENNKKTLAKRNDVTHPIHFDGNKTNISLTREKFNELTTDLLERTIALTDKVLEQAKSKGVTTIDSFLLVGGSTRMPQVEETIKEKYSASLGVKPVHFDVDEAVAKGAAKEAEILAIKAVLGGGSTCSGSTSGASEDDIRNVALLSGKTVDQIKSVLKTTTQKVATKSYGVKVVDKMGKEKISNIIIKQTPVPTETKKLYKTADDNSNVLDLVVYSNNENGEYADLNMCTKVGEIKFELPQKLDSNMPVDIQFTLTNEGKLLLFAHDLTHNQTREANFTPEGALTEEQMKEAQEKLGSLTVAQ